MVGNFAVYMRIGIAFTFANLSLKGNNTLVQQIELNPVTLFRLILFL